MTVMTAPAHEVGLPILWEKQGNVRWEDWWIDRQGKTRTRVPGLDDHIGFLRYDLANHTARSFNGVAVSWRLDIRSDGMWLVMVTGRTLSDDDQGRALQDAMPLLWDHGFEVDYERWGVPRPPRG